MRDPCYLQLIAGQRVSIDVLLKAIGASAHKSPVWRQSMKYLLLYAFYDLMLLSKKESQQKAFSYGSPELVDAMESQFNHGRFDSFMYELEIIADPDMTTDRAGIVKVSIYAAEHRLGWVELETCIRRGKLMVTEIGHHGNTSNKEPKARKASEFESAMHAAMVMKLGQAL